MLCLDPPLAVPADSVVWICPVCATADEEALLSIRKVMKELKAELSVLVKDISLTTIGGIPGKKRAAMRSIKYALRFDGRGGVVGSEPIITTLQRFIEKFCSDHELQTAFKNDCSASVDNIRDNIKARLVKFIKEQLLSSFHNRTSRSQEQKNVEYMKEAGQLETLFEEFWAVSQRNETFDIAFEVCFRTYTSPFNASPDHEHFCLVGAAGMFRWD
jgi:hypothetical protein